jgi:enamine deaminase RidA (YjgF/YER057c/UK114 family)
MTPEDKLRELGITLPEVPQPLGSYVPFVRTGNLVYVSGMLPIKEGQLTRTGRVGDAVTLQEAIEDARSAAINALAVVRSAVGTLDNVEQCIKITGYIASAPDFTDQPKVLNSASDLLFQIFGESGRHARAAVGVPVLPMNAPLEIEFIFEIRQETLSPL